MSHPTPVEKKFQPPTIAGRRVPIFPYHALLKEGTCSCNPGGLCKNDAPGKHPISYHGGVPIAPNGAHSATTDPEVLQEWERLVPWANIGISLEGLLIFDVDPRHGGLASWEAFMKSLKEKGVEWKPAYLVRTPGGGFHAYVLKPEGVTLRVNDLGEGIDVKTGSGQGVLVPPSRNGSGAYTVQQGDPSEVAALPEEVLEVIGEMSETGTLKLEAPTENGSSPTPPSNSTLDLPLLFRGVPEGARDIQINAFARWCVVNDVPQKAAFGLVDAMADGASPPFDKKAAREKVFRAYRELQAAPGGAEQTEVSFDDLVMSVDEILQQAGEKPPWIIDGLIAEGGITDIHGPAKRSGKTTLTMAAVKSVVTGTPFMGGKTQKTEVVYLSEQGNNLAKALRDARLEGVEGVHIIPRWKTKGMSWPEVVDFAVEYCQKVGAKMLVVDTFPAWANLDGEKENQSGYVKDALAPLLDAAQAHGLGIWEIRHSKKDGGARGSSQYDHDVDILLSLHPADTKMPPNVRVLEGTGRYDGIPQKSNIEFRDGVYYDLGSDTKIQFQRAKEAISDILESQGRLERKNLVELVTEETGVSGSTVGTALDELRENGVIVRNGKGVKGDPYGFELLENGWPFGS